jgi:Arabinose efflux permease
MNHGLQVLRQVGKKFPRRNYRCLPGGSFDGADNVVFHCTSKERGIDTGTGLNRDSDSLSTGLHRRYPRTCWKQAVHFLNKQDYAQYFNPGKNVANSYRCFHSKHQRDNYCRRQDPTVPPTTTSSSSGTTFGDSKSPLAIMDKRLLFQYLQLKDFTPNEMNAMFDKILHSRKKNEKEKESLVMQSSIDVISKEHMTKFIFDRLKDIDAMQQECHAKILAQEEKQQVKEEEEKEKDVQQLDSSQMDPAEKAKVMRLYAESECKKAMALLHKVGNKPPSNSIQDGNSVIGNITREEFQAKLRILATEIDTARTIPISVSMLLVGSSVGIIIPVMPYVVSNLGLSAGEFGMVVSSFAFSKLLSNIPAAILVERHGRKPYLVYSLVIICCGVGGIGFASQFEHLILCRSLTGIGVSLLRTAATLSIADCSTTLNRARSMATMMSSFAAGMSLGPAVGGILADKIGLHSTFYLVGGIYLAVASINLIFYVTETKVVPRKGKGVSVASG